MNFVQGRLRPFLLCMFLCALYPAQAPGAAEDAALTISNQSGGELLNIRFTANRKVFFVRLDMQPGGSDEIENPGGTADLRLDTGLALCFFKSVPLGQARRLTFCGDHAACLILDMRNKLSRHFSGRMQSLLPGPESRPACTLEQFHPGMSMSEVCGLLGSDPPRDDNDAVLAGLGFAGLTWAARLSPAQSPAAGRASAQALDRLDHLELRRPLNAENLAVLLRALYTQGYSPWQAELPGLDMNFTEMTDPDVAKQKDILQKALDYFLASGRGEATIMLAPAAMLPALANADAPQNDVQLFTVTLRQASRTLIVDVAAYPAGEGGR